VNFIVLSKYKGDREIGWKVWAGCIWLRIMTCGISYEHSNERLGSIKDGEFLD
jgi:hypothetical protein